MCQYALCQKMSPISIFTGLDNDMLKEEVDVFMVVGGGLSISKIDLGGFLSTPIRGSGGGGG